MQIFIVGPPRSGTTVAAQAIDAHPQVKIFDEVDLLDIAMMGSEVVRRGRRFLSQRDMLGRFTNELSTRSAPQALDTLLAGAIAPRTIWGEKNPAYADRLQDLYACFPEAFVIFMLRDPRQIVNSYLKHRRSIFRERDDFWIKDTVEEALALVETLSQPALRPERRVHVLRYEGLVTNPTAALDNLFAGTGLSFAGLDVRNANQLPEGVGDEQFYRGGNPLPWKIGNLSPLASARPCGDRLDPHDPAWKRVDELAERLGYA